MDGNITILNHFSFMKSTLLIFMSGVVGILCTEYELSHDLPVTLYGDLALGTNLAGLTYADFDVTFLNGDYSVPLFEHFNLYIIILSISIYLSPFVSDYLYYFHLYII